MLLSAWFQLESDKRRRDRQTHAQGVDRPQGIATAQLPGGSAHFQEPARPQCRRTDRTDRIGANARSAVPKLATATANYFIVHPGASSRDVLRLIDLVRSRVQERFNVELEQEIAVW